MSVRLGMVFDLNRCIGCWACAIACKVENNIGEGYWWQEVLTIGGPRLDTSVGEFPMLSKHYQPRNCFHCADPPCLPACPVDAISQRPDGIVLIDYATCIGCNDCVPACPYDAIELHLEAPKLPAQLEAGHGAREVPPRRAGVAEKCTFCVHRVDQGLACVLACPTGVISFGDVADPESDVAKLAAHPNAIRIGEELGADPSTWYLPYTKGARQRRSGSPLN